MMRVDHKLFRRAFVEVLVALRSLVEGDDGRVAGFGRVDAVMQDRLHELPVVPQDGALAGVERTGFGPTESDANAERSDFGGFVDRARIAGDVQARNADRAARANHFL